MKPVAQLVIVIASLIVGANCSLAQTTPSDGKLDKTAPAFVLPPGVEEDMLAPPPVPRFMLEKPATPLTMDEMMQQAREAERKAGARRGTVESVSEGQTPKHSN